MYVEIDKAIAKITSVTPIMEKHGKKKKRPAHSIIFELAMSNTVLDRMDNNGLRDAFYRKPVSASVDPKTKQTSLDASNVADGLSQLKFMWWDQWIEIPGELTGWVLSLHIGNTERSHIVLEEAKISGFAVLPKDLAITLVKCKAIVHPTAHEKGKIDELLQTEVKISILPPTTPEQGDMIGHTSDPDEDDEDQDNEDEVRQEGETNEQPEAEQPSALGEPPREDPFAGTELARGVVNSDATVETKKSRRVAAEADE